MRIHILNSLVAIVVLCYIFFGLFITLNQSGMIYYPDRTDFRTCPGFFDYEKHAYNTTRYYQKSGDENYVVFFHGNAGSACDRAELRPILEKENNTVIFVEYAGYSADEARPSAAAILQNARDIVQVIPDHADITVIGESIGTGPASYFASIRSTQKIILRSPFHDLRELVQKKFPLYPVSLLLKEHYPNTEWLASSDADILIIHGSADIVIPMTSSQKIKDLLPTKNITYVTIVGAGHNDIYLFSKTRESIHRFI
ncbi:alpha/beta hydrolase [Candidatus Woesearchaeota archaeon]|nr:alpha/beta hydrolase [Candidatus Woesearchaeota archaeon]